MSQQFKYYAFISYSSKDTEWGKRLQRKLEHYRIPATLCSEHGWDRTPIKPVFFAPTDIQPGGLDDELQERLKASRNLIIICSPNSARSEWVGKEIEYFHSLGRAKQIHFFIVEGKPYSDNPDTECINPVIKKLGLPEILGANVHEKVFRWPWLNKERAYAQIVSKLLGLEFDTIWQRHKRLLISRTIIGTFCAFAVLAILASVWLNNKPVDVKFRLNETSFINTNLPPLRDAVVTMELDNETKKDTLVSANSCLVFTNIPHRFNNRKVHVVVEAKDYQTTDTIILLKKHMVVDIIRNPKVYGDIRFRLWNPYTQQPAINTEVTIDSHSVSSDADGNVFLFIPLEGQKTAYPIKSTAIRLKSETLYMPCGPDDNVLYE